jgi:hypothetical protein
MATVVDIPTTIRQVTTALNGLGRLLNAKQWERAAIVYAFTHDGRGEKPGKPGSTFTFKEFAKLGINGLRDPDVVSEYRRIWANAIEDGHAPECVPGDSVELPVIDWPGRQDDKGKKRYTETTPDAFARRINNMKPDERDVFVEAMTQDLKHDAIEAIVERTAEDRPAIVHKQHRKIIEREAREDAARLREFDDSMRRALPMPQDQATDYLDGAASDLANAIFCREEFGLEYLDSFNKALDRVERNLKVLRGNARLTDRDREWAASIGVSL